MKEQADTSPDEGADRTLVQDTSTDEGAGRTLVLMKEQAGH